MLGARGTAKEKGWCIGGWWNVAQGMVVPPVGWLGSLPLVQPAVLVDCCPGLSVMRGAGLGSGEDGEL